MWAEIEKWYGVKSVVRCEIGAVGQPEVVRHSTRSGSDPLRIAWSGLHEDRKALPLLLKALADLPVDSRVTVIEQGPCFAPEMAIPRRWRTLHILREHDTELLTGARALGFTERGVEISSDGDERTVEADSILLASGVVPDGRLADALLGIDCEVHRIGDADAVGYIEGAILSGARIGRAL